MMSFLEYLELNIMKLKNGEIEEKEFWQKVGHILLQVQENYSYVKEKPENKQKKGFVN